MINAISAAYIAFIMSSSESTWLPSPLKCSPQQQNNRMLRLELFMERGFEKFVEDKDAKNTKRSAKVARQVFQEYLKEKKTTEPEEN